MRIKDQFEVAIDGDYVDLQALIMFLVFEKKILTMEDHIAELDRYFLEKHNKRMNQELIAYKGKMNIEYDKLVMYEILHDRGTIYIAAYNLDQAKFIAVRNKINPISASLIDEDLDMLFENKRLKSKDLSKGKPRIIGGFH